MEKKNIDRSISIIFIVCIVLAVSLNVFMRSKIQEKEGFSEIYFTRPESIPKKVLINSTYETSFVIVNHELNVTSYIYEVESKINTTFVHGNVTLQPGERTLIKLSFIPLDKNWEFNMSTDEQEINKLAVLQDNVIGRNNELRLIVANTSLRHYLPISFDVPGFGYTLHTNLSISELEKKPLTKSQEYKRVESNQSFRRAQNVTLFSADGEVFVSSTKREEIHVITPAPFVVKLYRESSIGDVNPEKEIDVGQRLYFWYEVVG